MHDGDLVAKSYPTLATPGTVACQAPLSMGFSRQKYWSGLPFPSPSVMHRVLYTVLSLWKNLDKSKLYTQLGLCITQFYPNNK